MSLLTGRTPKKTPHPHKGVWTPTQDEDDSKSLIQGVILAAIIWPTLVLILWLGTRHLGAESHASPFKPVRRAPLSIQLAPDEFIMPRKPAPPKPKFVETNPNAPENIPDKTDNFAAQNQQAAQEKPNPDAHGDRAATEGKKDFESNQIVSGQLTPQATTPAPTPPTPEIAQALEKAAAAQKAQNPLPGTEKLEGPSLSGYGTNIAKAAENATSVPEKVEGLKDAPLMVGNPAPSQPRIDPQKPQPRQHIEQQRVRPAIFTENRVGTSNIGIAGIDARWSNYGAYLQRLVDSVQMQFDRLVEESRVYPPSGTMVTVKFRLDAVAGAVTEVINVESTGGKQAASVCTSAITSRAPYGAWTDDMKAMLGDSQEMEFRFYYGTP